MKIPIVIDSREQAPFSFEGYPVEVMTGTLTTGDYSVSGFEDRIAVERKGLNDLLGCLTHDRERFIREMERLRGFESAAVVVEAPFDALAEGRYRSRMNPDSAVQSVVSIIQAYRMPFFFAVDRRQAEAFAFDFLRHFCRHTETRFAAVCSWLGCSGNNESGKERRRHSPPWAGA